MKITGLSIWVYLLLVCTCFVEGQKIVEQGRLVLSKPTETITRMMQVFPPDLDGKSPYSSVEISQQCQRDLLLVIEGQIALEEWAWLAIDAAGQVGAGVYEGNANYLGNYDECQKVKATNKKYTISVGGKYIQHEHTSDGKYCRVFWNVENQYFSRGDCVPSSCTDKDIRFIYILGNESSLPVTHVYVDEGRDFLADPSAIVGAVITAVFVLLVLIVSIVDSCLWCKAQKEHDDVTAKSLNNVAMITPARHVDPEVAPETDPESPEDQSASKYSSPPEVTSPQEASVMVVAGGEQTVTTTPAENSPTKDSKKQGKCAGIFFSFSLLRNIPPLLSTDGGGRTYGCMNGLRVIAMLWIVYGHSYQLGLYLLADPRSNILENFDSGVLEKFNMAFINRNNLAVEVFFVLSGCLVTLSFLKALERNGGKQSLKQMIMYYLHRWIRLTPVYMFIIMMYASLFPYFGNGPTDPEMMDYNFCREKWWINLFYLQNIINTRQACLAWSWYVANDWGYYCVAPLFIFLLYRFPKTGKAVLVVTYILYAIVRMAIMILTNGNFHETYIPPWTRIGPYLIGIALGYTMFVTKCKVDKMNKCLKVFLWCWAVVSIGLAFTEFPYFNVYKGDMISVGVAIITFLCCAGYGGWLNGFLSWKFFVPLGRLTYVGYLLHPILLFYQHQFSSTPFYMEESTMFFMYHGIILTTFIISFFITLVFEIPFLELEKKIMPKRG